MGDDFSAPKREPEKVLKALADACRAHPEQRVMQVVVNALGLDPFYHEDHDACVLLESYAEQGKA